MPTSTQKIANRRGDCQSPANLKMINREEKMEENKEEKNFEPEKRPNNKKLKITIIAILVILLLGGIAFGVKEYGKRKCGDEDIRNRGVYYDPDNPENCFKPIIYLYPEAELEAIVTLGKSEMITTSYPKYTNGWKVLAQPNGDLLDLSTNRKLYALYYENKNSVNFKIEKDGFVVKGENVAEFLEEKLAILGLTQREVEEFIIYWLPKLEANHYNYIRFATQEEIGENMPLQIEPNPDTIIRVLMTFKGLEQPMEVEEQTLVTPERTGFVTVEWGGTEIK